MRYVRSIKRHEISAPFINTYPTRPGAQVHTYKYSLTIGHYDRRQLPPYPYVKFSSIVCLAMYMQYDNGVEFDLFHNRLVANMGRRFKCW